MKRADLLHVPFLALLLLVGCKHAGGAGAGKALAETAVVAAAVTTQAVAAAAASRESSSGSSENDPDPPPDPYPAPPLPPFDEAEARAELRNADISACVPTQETKVHARVTFDPDGPVAQVVVDEPHDLPEPLARCVGAALSSAHVYAFTPAGEAPDATTTITLTLRKH